MCLDKSDASSLFSLFLLYLVAHTKQKTKCFIALEMGMMFFITDTASKIETIAAETILFLFQFYRSANCMFKHV